MVALAALLPAQFASAAEGPTGSVPITAGQLDWGLRQNFRNYVSGGGDPVPIAASDGATINGDGTFRFPVASGFYHPETGTTIVRHRGKVVFSYSSHFFKITVSNPTVEIGFSAQRLRADILTEVTNPEYGSSSEVIQGEVGALDIDGITPSIAGGTTTWSAIPGEMTTAGAESFAGYLWPGAELDPVSFSYTGPGGLPTADIPGDEPEPADDTWTDPGTVVLAAKAGGAVETPRGLAYHEPTNRVVVRDASGVRAFDADTLEQVGAVTGLEASVTDGFFIGADGHAYAISGDGGLEKTVTGIDVATMTVRSSVVVDPMTLPNESYFTSVYPDPASNGFFAYVEDRLVEIGVDGVVRRTSEEFEGSPNSVLVDPADGTIYAWRFTFGGGSMTTAVHALERNGASFTALGRSDLAGQFMPRFVDHRTGRIYALANLGGIKTVVFEARESTEGAVDQLGAPFSAGGFSAPVAYDPSNQDVWHTDLASGSTTLVDMATRQNVAVYAERLTDKFAIAPGSRVFAASATNVVELIRSVSPSIIADPESVTVELAHRETAGEVTLTAEGAGQPEPTVRWQSAAPAGPWGPSPWVDVPDATEATLTFDATTADSGRRFRAVFTNEVGTYGTQPATVTVATAPRPPADERWLDQAALDLVGQPLDTAGRAYWLDRLEGGQSRESVGRALAASRAARAKTVTDLYTQYLHRPAEAAAIDYWVGRFDANNLAPQLRRNLVGSQEYLSAAGGTLPGYVDAVYVDLLRRPAEAAGRDYWVGRLGTTADRASIIGVFSRTTEARGALVDDYHRALLDRPATAAERSRGAAALAAHGTELRLVASLVATFEYADRT